MKEVDQERSGCPDDEELFIKIDHFFAGEQHRKNLLRFGPKSMEKIKQVLPGIVQESTESLPRQSKL